MATIKKQYISEIQVNGSNEIFGGKIYYFNTKFNFSEAPNEVQINIINELGSYSPPTLDFSLPYNIEINGGAGGGAGGMKLGDFYPIKYKTRASSNGTILEVTFIDETFVLDKIFIGLNSKHGWLDVNAKKMDLSKNKTWEEIMGIRSFDSSSSSSSSSSSAPSEEGKLYQKINDYFYLIGRPLHPCDTNQDNTVDFNESTNFDYCDPCPSCPDDKYEKRCEELSYLQIFEVGYSLEDLSKMLVNYQVKQAQIVFDIDFGNLLSSASSSSTSSAPSNFYRDHHGPLREVITAWANDYGAVWYYNGEEKKIKFLDISSREIRLDAAAVISKYNSADPKQLISYEQEKDISSTTQRGVISWYERAGEKKSYNCSKGASLVLSALYAADFIGNRERTLNSKKFNSNSDSLGAVLKQYHPILREAFWTRDQYGMTDAESVADYLTTFQSGTSLAVTGEDDIEYTPGDFILPEFGDMRVLAVIDQTPITRQGFTFHEEVKGAWGMLKKQLNSAEQERLILNSGFFVVTYVDQDAYEKRLAMEDELYSFMGKFFVREHLFRLCGITGNDEFVKENTSIETSDGSAQIYSKKDGISTNPLSRYRYYKDGYLGCCMGGSNVFSGDVAAPTPTAGGGSPTVPQSTQGIMLKEFQGNVVPQDTPDDYASGDGLQGSLFSKKNSNQHIPRLEQTTVILEREPKWVPEASIFQEVHKDYIVQKYGNLQWKLFNNDGVPGNFKALRKVFGAESNLKSGYAGNIKTFIVYPGDFNTTVNWEATEDHPTDKKAQQTRKTVRRIGGKYGTDVFIGLIDNKCHYIDLNDPVLRGIYTPPHTFVPKPLTDKLIDNVGSATAGGKGGGKTLCDKILSNSAEMSFRKPAYRVFVSQSFNQEVKTPKIQTGVFSNMDNVTGVRTLDVIENIFTSDDFFAFTGSGVSYGCVPNLNWLSGLHSAYTGKVYSDNAPQDNLIINIKGMPQVLSLEDEIKQGFSNLSMQISDNGMTSTIEYNTKRIKSISKDLIKFFNTRRYLTKAK